VVITGDLTGKEMVSVQPTKMAAAENITEQYPDGKAPFTLLPGVHVFPGLLNWLYGTDVVQTIPQLQAQYEQDGYMQFNRKTGEAVPGTELQQQFAPELQQLQGSNAVNPIPNTTVEFYSFRLMITVGLLAVLCGIILLIAIRGGRIPKPKPIWTVIAVLMPLLPLIANSFGWIFTEMGRQPWIVNGVLPTAQAVSPTIGLGGALTATPQTGGMWLSLVLYTLLYGVLAVVEVRLLLHNLKPGLPEQVTVSKKDEAEPLSFAY